MKKREPKIKSIVVCVFVFLWVFFGCTAAAQAQLVSVGILVFQDETGQDIPAALAQKLARDIQQKLVLSYRDLLPRLIGDETGAAEYKSKTAGELAEIGRQQGLKFLVRGGILALTSEARGKKIEVNVVLYAEIVSVETGSVNAARASGASTTKGISPDLQWDTIDFSGADFPESALGLALSMAVDQLAAAVHGAVTAPAELAVGETGAAVEEETAYEEEPVYEESGAEEESGVSEETGAYDEGSGYEDTSAYTETESDEELQQLITQAEELIYNSTAGTETLEALSQALQSLQEALNTKVSLLEQGGDTTQVDQEIAQRKQELENLIYTATEEVSSESAYEETGEAYSGEESKKKKGLLASIGSILDQSLDIIQKIKEIRSTLRGADEESQYEETGETGYEETGTEYDDTGYEDYEETQEEEATSDISGIVTEDGGPAEGVVVTDPESGVSTTTDSSGSYVLQGIPSGRLSKLLLLKDGKPVGGGKVDLLKGRAAIADWELKPRVVQKGKKRAAAPRILPSLVNVAPAKKAGGGTGTLKGVVRDAKGKPMPRVLVKLEGAAVVRSDSRGRYAFVNVPAGTYRLLVLKGGRKVKIQQVTIAAKKSVLNKIRFSPGDSAVVKTKPAGIIFGGSGTVLQGVVTDAKNRPLAGVKVTVFQSGGAVSVKTGPRGTYKLLNIKPGKYRLLISKTGFTGINRHISVTAKKTANYNFKLITSASSSYMKTLLVKQRSLTGRIIDSRSKKPIAYATVYIKGYKSVRTNRSGYYTIRNVKPGSYSVTISKNGYRSRKLVVKVSAQQSTRADFVLSVYSSGRVSTSVTKPKTGRITLPSKTRTAYLSPGQIKGTVTDSKTRRPIAGAYVTISGQRSIVTSRSGYYASARLKPGRYTVSVKRSGYMSSTSTVQVPAGKAVTLNVRLSPLIIKFRKK